MGPGIWCHVGRGRQEHPSCERVAQRWMPGRCQDVADTLGVFYHSKVAEWLRAFVRKAPGSSFCALKVHIKSISVLPLVFLPDAVSPLLQLRGEDFPNGQPQGPETGADPESRRWERRGKCSLCVGSWPCPAPIAAPLGASDMWESPRRKPGAKKTWRIWFLLLSDVG